MPVDTKPTATGALPAVTMMLAALLGACVSAPPPPDPSVEQVPHPWSTAPFEASGTGPGAGRSPAGRVNPAAAAQPDQVHVLCLVVQGNGFNWAATLGWLASQVELTARRAAAFERDHPGRLAGVDLRCVTGSSSGGAAASLLDHLLANPNLTGEAARADGLLSPAQASAVSQALFFFALSADFRGETIALGATALGAYTGLLDRESQAVRVDYWRASTTSRRAQRIFGDWIAAASQYDPAWFTELTGGDPYALPSFRELGRDLALGDDSAPARQMAALGTRARRVLKQRTDARRFDWQPVGDGVCVTFLAAPLGPDATPPFAMADLELYAVCNETTFDRLRDDGRLAAALAASTQTGERLRLARAASWPDLLNVTVREPELTTALTGRLLEPPIDMGALAAFDGTSMADYAPSADYLVFGGFAVPKLQAWPALAIAQARAGRAARGGAEVVARVALFGRGEDRDDPGATFAQRMIDTWFAVGADANADADAASGEGTADSLAVYYAWQDEFCDATDRLGATVRTDQFSMDWNLSPRPAAMTRQSHELAALGYNLGKVQLDAAQFPELAGEWFDTFLFASRDSAALLPLTTDASAGCPPRTIFTPAPGGGPISPRAGGEPVPAGAAGDRPAR